ncbi:MAG: NAD(+)/NADH kinase [Puniceicoccaceae bacterium]|nr:MAG: NAD(+)/NADH kinase [Puniceicoccaceae bacterium]
MQAIKTITFAVNTTKPGALEAARYLAGIAECEGAQARITTDYPLTAHALDGQDLCCTIGGDGTLLGILDAALESGAAVLGVNLGKLGFLATFTQEEAGRDLPRLIQGHYTISERSVLCCTTRNGEFAYGLNDVVLKETDGSGLIRLQVDSNGNPVSEYHCDGLIFSTPTGSTAYNLSAGGPIIGPRVSAIAMTPICPHTLGNRSVIFDNSSQISVNHKVPGPCPRITIDGRVQFKSEDNFPIEISVAERSFRLMQNPDHSHFAIVRSKLKWGDPTIR